MLLIGLTGGIASGKSTVTALLEELGACVIDADEVYHQLIDTAPLISAISSAFGTDYVDDNGLIDRKKLGKLVFSDKSKLELLNSIAHPAVLNEIHSIISKIKKGEKYSLCILSVPLLYEIGIDKETQAVITVSVSPEIQLHRLCQRAGISREEAQKRIDSQMPLKEKIRRADYVINNDGSREDTEKQVRKLYQQLTTNDGQEGSLD